MSKNWNIADTLISYLRFNQIDPSLLRNKVVCDFGCGRNGDFLKSISKIIKSGIGIDYKVNEFKNNHIELKPIKVDNVIPISSCSVDIITFLAVLEHIEDPTNILSEFNRILKANGLVILTTPDKSSKRLLEFLAYRLKVINEDEIRDHKKYYNRRMLYDLFENSCFSIMKHKHFQFGLNNLMILRKK